MTRAQVMQWLLTLGKDWVGLIQVYKTYGSDPLNFWDSLTDWHDGAYVTKRFNDYNYEKYHKDIDRGIGIEEYKLTRKALTLLGERTSDDRD